jgi:hypothetical protein
MAVTSKELRASTPDAHAGGGISSDTVRLTLIEWLTPTWGRQAARSVQGYVGFSPGLTIACGLLALVTTAIGVGLLFGDGYATIQGVRWLLRLMGLTIVRVDDFPPLEWWTIQVVLVFIQVFAKKVKGMRRLWTPSYVFNAATTAIFIAIGLGLTSNVQFSLSPMSALVGSSLCSVAGAVLGHSLALGAEQVTLTGLCMLGAVYTGLFAK